MGIKLTICIPTFNRSSFLAGTLDSILSQLTPECEVLVVDNASSDSTPEVVLAYAERCSQLRYFRQETNVGLDRNYDTAVQQSQGEYCWLFTDDDLLKPGAVDSVLGALQVSYSLVVVNLEFRDYEMRSVLKPRHLERTQDRVYAPDELDQLFVDLQGSFWSICNLVIKRDVWMSRDRARYYGSLFIHVGVLFQKALPGPVLLIAEPLVSYRLGNDHGYTNTLAEVFFHRLPSITDTLSVSKESSKRVRITQPWRSLSWLLFIRARGYYSKEAYHRWVKSRTSSVLERARAFVVAILPALALNYVLAFWYEGRPKYQLELYILRRSRAHLAGASFRAAERTL
jgi:abequosyltransferase